MTVAILARALGARRVGATWMARCPIHDDSKPSLSISSSKNGKVLVRCHAGCDQTALITALRERGLWQSAPGRFARDPRRGVLDQPDANALKRSEAAMAIWRVAQPPDGTHVAAYLDSRGLVLPDSSDLRFSARLRHPSGALWPVMVALVTHGETGSPIGIHRTFLAHDGNGKAPVDPAKMMMGPCRGGVVRLATPRDVLMIGEGIETSLAAMQATGNAAWAALSTSGLRSLKLPRDIRKVIVLADGDEPGEMAAQNAALRWKHEGRHVRIARPPTGTDFNDLLMRAPQGSEDEQ